MTTDKHTTEVLKTTISTLEEAKVAVETASSSLEKLLSEIKSAPRAEKTAVSQAIESALQVLRTAREKVVDAEQTLEHETTSSSSSSSSSGSKTPTP